MEGEGYVVGNTRARLHIRTCADALRHADARAHGHEAVCPYATHACVHVLAHVRTDTQTQLLARVFERGLSITGATTLKIQMNTNM